MALTGSVEATGDVVVLARDLAGLGGHAACLRGVFLGDDVALGVVVEILAELSLRVLDEDAVLRALRAGDGRLDGGQVQLEVLGVLGFLGVLFEPHALRLGVGLDALDLLLGAAGELQVLHGLFVDREDGRGGAELRRHVADGGAVSQRDGLHAVAVELDELLHHAVLAQHVGDGENHVGGGHTGRDLAGQLEADDLRDEHGDRLAQHGSLGLDAADAPAQDAQAVFHGGVGVGTDTSIRVRQALVVEDDAGQVLDVDLVNNAGSRRNDAEVGEVLRTPAQELVALLVALVLDLYVLIQSFGGAEGLRDHGVVDDHLSRVERVDLIRGAAQVGHGLAHGCQVDNTRNAGEVLHENAGRGELNLGVRLSFRVPVSKRLNVIGGDVLAVLVTQQVFCKNLQRVGKLAQPLNLVDVEVLVGLVAYFQGLLSAERIQAFSHRELHSLSEYCSQLTALRVCAAGPRQERACRTGSRTRGA